MRQAPPPVSRSTHSCSSDADLATLKAPLISITPSDLQTLYQQVQNGPRLHARFPHVELLDTAALGFVCHGLLGNVTQRHRWHAVRTRADMPERCQIWLTPHHSLQHSARPTMTGSPPHGRAGLHPRHAARHEQPGHHRPGRPRVAPLLHQTRPPRQRAVPAGHRSRASRAARGRRRCWPSPRAAHPTCCWS